MLRQVTAIFFKSDDERDIDAIVNIVSPEYKNAMRNFLSCGVGRRICKDAFEQVRGELSCQTRITPDAVATAVHDRLRDMPQKPPAHPYYRV